MTKNILIILALILLTNTIRVQHFEDANTNTNTTTQKIEQQAQGIKKQWEAKLQNITQNITKKIQEDKETLANKTTQAGNAIQNATQNIAGNITNTTQAVKQQVKNATNEFKETIKNATQAITGNITKAEVSPSEQEKQQKQQGYKFIQQKIPKLKGVPINGFVKQGELSYKFVKDGLTYEIQLLPIKQQNKPTRYKLVGVQSTNTTNPSQKVKITTSEISSFEQAIRKLNWV